MTLLQRILTFLASRLTAPGPTVPAPTPGDVAAQLLALVNDQRQRARVAPLAPNAALTAAAQQYAATEARLGLPETHGDFVGRIRAAGYTGGAVGENIGQGQATAEEIVSDWVSSPGHYANLVNPTYRDVGFGRAGNYWVADFGG